MTDPLKPVNKHEIIDRRSPQVTKKEEEEKSNFANLIAEVSTLAWNLVIPIIGGVMLGHYLDNRNQSDFTWTLSLLVLGVIIAFSNLYNLYIEQGKKKLNTSQPKSEEKQDHAKDE